MIPRSTFPSTVNEVGSCMTIGLILTLIFLVLKLTGYINWSWFLVCLPVMIEFIVSLSWRRSPFWWRNPGP
jgi:hypothetical protein